MITLDLQMFAKSASQAREYRKKKAKLKYELEAELKPKEEEKKTGASEETYWRRSRNKG